MPPLLTRKSNVSRSQVAQERARTASANASKLATSPTSSCSATALAAERLDLGDDVGGLVGVAAVGEDHVDAAAGEVQRGAAPDAAVAAGDECDAGHGGDVAPGGAREKRSA